VSHTVRTIHRADLFPTSWGAFCLRFKANGFLRHMVRNMVGLLIRIGLERISLKELERVIQAKDRSRAGEMAPAQGLFLRKVLYPPTGSGDFSAEGKRQRKGRTVGGPPWIQGTQGPRSVGLKGNAL
jgi:tRNA U38,U39,U40 pseudouridine synthase TruA